jgi:hypothetical protein
MRSKNLIAAALSGLALCAAATETASADSISYIKNGNVWLSTPDGSRQFQVTDTGGYSSASQADNGTIVALKGQRIHKLDRLGNVQADISTAVSDGTDDTKQWGVSHFVGPYDLDLSPDGTKVSYNWHWQHWTNFGSSYYYHYLRQGVGVSHLDHTTGWDELGYQTGWLDAAWYDNDTLTYGYKASSGMVDIAVNEIGRQNTGSQNWFKSDVGSLLNMRAPAVSPDKRLVAVVGDSGGPNPYGPGEQLWTVVTNGEAPAAPAGFCNGYFGADGGKFSSPTFSPDSGSLAWAEGNGVWVAGAQTDCQGGDASANGRLVIPGGKDPDWSKADVPTGRPVVQQPGGGGGSTGDSKTSTTTTVVPAPKPTPIVAPRIDKASEDRATSPSSKPAATVSLTCRRACSVTGKVVAPKALARQLKLGGAALATGKAKRSAKGSVRLELQLTAKGRAAAAKLKGRKLTLRVTIKEGGKTRRLTQKVALG